MRQELLATQQDIVACYRIFLNREPDEQGFRAFSKLVDGGISVQKLAELLRGSTEALLVKSQQESGELTTVRLPGFSMLILPAWNAISAELSATNNYEPHISSHLKEMVRPGMVFVDIGANIGFYSMLAASKGAEVEAFEPHGRNIWFLKKNAEINKFNINIHPVALADSERLFLYAPIGGNGQIAELTDSVPAEDHQILQARSLDCVLGQKIPSIVKIDVEGAEGIVMRGAQRSLDAKPVVFSEFSAAAMNAGPVSAIEYLNMFVLRGYKLSLCRRDGSLKSVDAKQLEQASLDSESSFVDFVAIA